MLGMETDMNQISIKEVMEAVDGKIIYGSEDGMISSVSTNSKEMNQGSLFIPIVGENRDAHDFIEDAYKNGAIACFTSKKDIYHKNITCIKVEDTKEALQRLGTYYRSKFPIPVIGITGSVGKTTTKEMISAVLSMKYNVLKTAGNMNSQVGLPLMMLRLEKEHEIAVIEMGISEEGEMERLAAIAKPDIAVITNIGVSHIAQLKTKENIRKEKMNIINEFHDNSILFVNGDDPLLHELAVTYSSQNFDKIDLYDKTYVKFGASFVTSFGTEESCDYKATNIRVEGGKTYFTLIKSNKKQELTNLVQEEIVLNVLGRHNIYNALCSLAIAEYYNVEFSMAKKGLESYRPIAMRGEIKEGNGIKVIDDTYNASPDSMISGIHVLLDVENVRRRIAVLADVLELGDLSEKCHYDVGVFISNKNIDELVTIGNQARFIAKAVKDRNSSIMIHSFQNNKDAILYLSGIIKEGDALLVKGSRTMKTEEIVEELLT
jgi:UDP-N-acetylmuramoyl-tripeptide--D-alanyl-D-alanine ligase